MTVRAIAERAALTRAKRVIVKIGSRTLARRRRASSRASPRPSRERTRGTAFVVVSSGAIALGMKKLGYRARPKEMARLQAAAAAGQSLLMRAYEEAFERAELAVAQVLLTHADLADRTRANNARAALGALLEAGARAHPQRERLGGGRRDQVRRQRPARGDGGAARRRRPGRAPQRRRGPARRRRARASPSCATSATEALPHVRKSTRATSGSGGMASKVEAARRATLAGRQRRRGRRARGRHARCACSRARTSGRSSSRRASA